MLLGLMLWYFILFVFSTLSAIILRKAGSNNFFPNITSYVIILDVRTEAEYEDTHIKGAINIPLDKIDENTLHEVKKAF